jgi:DNA modification methylase
LITLVHGDCLEKMADMAPESVDLVVTSPPYDNLREYKGYSFNFEMVAEQLVRVLAPGGAIVWIVADATVDGSETGTSFKQALHFKSLGLNLHDTMIWKKPTFTAVGALQTRYAPVFEYMFVFSKGKNKTFNPLKDRPNKYAGAKIHSNIRQADGSLRPKSNLGKVSPEYGQRFNVWEVSGVQSNKERTGHPAMFPVELATDHVLSWSNPGDTVLDPFMGSGTTGVAAVSAGRDFIGIEISQEYLNIAQRRIECACPSLFPTVTPECQKSR